MSVNLSKNGVALMEAYKEVVDGRVDTNWALFTYEGNSNDIRLAQTGEGGLEELVEELSSGKVMYAFCRVQDPNSGLPKYVLINWTGEGVKDSRKGVCANHLGSMASFLKGAHVTINARAEEDVEPETILAKVAKASGANFNFHERTPYKESPRGSVGSVYRRVNAVEEIQLTNKDDFWSKDQREEEGRRQEELKRAELERERLQKERKEMDEREERERERRDRERERELTTAGSVYRRVNAVEEIQLTNKDDFWSKDQREEEGRRQEELKRAELERERLQKERKEMDEREERERERRDRERERELTTAGSVYRRVNAVEEIQLTNKDDFWSKDQREEEGRRQEELKRAELERERLQKERKEMDEREERERERRDRERERELTTAGSGYRRVNAMEEIQQTNKEDFWSQTQREEEGRRQEEQKRAELERQKLQKERKEMDEREERERERRDRERAARLKQDRIYQKQREEEEEREREREQQRQSQQETDGKKTSVSSAPSVQKANEAKSLISQRSINPRDIFKKKEQSFDANSEKSSPSWRKSGKLRSPFLSKKTTEAEAPPSQPQFPLIGSSSSSAPSEPARSRANAIIAEVTPEPETPASPVHHTDGEEEWSDEFEDDEPTPEDFGEEDLYEATGGEANPSEDLYENLDQYQGADDQLDGDANGEDIRARALFDYQAADDTEITFDPDDIIYGIEMVDEGWWRGYGPDGHYGLFPANYVELI